MKSTITFLGLAALLFVTNAKAADAFKTQNLNQQDTATVQVVNEQQNNQLLAVNQEFSNDTVVGNTDDTVVLDANSALKANNQKAVAEIIADNNLITDSKEENVESPLLERTLEQYIDENNQITESTVSEVYPLDFEKINRSVKSNKVDNNNIAVTVDLKL